MGGAKEQQWAWFVQCQAYNKLVIPRGVLPRCSLSNLSLALVKDLTHIFFDRCRISHVNCEITKLKLGNTQHPHNCAVAPVLKG